MLSATKIGLTAGLAVLMLGASACSPRQGDMGNKNIRSNQVRPYATDHRYNAGATPDGMNRYNTARPYGNVTPYAGNAPHNATAPYGGQTKMELSKKIADHITAMNEVKSSYVMLTNQNAYVAVVLHSTAPSATPKAAPGQTKPSATPKAAPGQTKPSATPNAAPGRTKPAPSMTSADVPAAIKSKIAQKVKSVDPRVKNVYVTANPDFVGRMTSYAAEVNRGRPISGFATEFYSMVQRLFPTNAAKRTVNQPTAPGHAPSPTTGVGPTSRTVR